MTSFQFVGCSLDRRLGVDPFRIADYAIDLLGIDALTRKIPIHHIPLLSSMIQRMTIIQTQLSICQLIVSPRPPVTCIDVVNGIVTALGLGVDSNMDIGAHVLSINDVANSSKTDL